MKSLFRFALVSMLFSCLFTAGSAVAADQPEALKWDSDAKEYNVKTGEASAPFTFTATNVSAAAVSINQLQTTCGCTAAQLPSTPYVLQPGSNVTISVSMNLAGKAGAVAKQVIVQSSAGTKVLQVRANIPTRAAK